MPWRPVSFLDPGGQRLLRVLLVITNGSLAIVALWALLLKLTGADAPGVTLALVVLAAPVLNVGLVVAGRVVAVLRR